MGTLLSRSAISTKHSESQGARQQGERFKHRDKGWVLFRPSDIEGLRGERIESAAQDLHLAIEEEKSTIPAHLVHPQLTKIEERF